MRAAAALLHVQSAKRWKNFVFLMTGQNAERGALVFGEQVMFRLAPKKRHVKEESQWESGVFVGMIIRTSENERQKEPRSCVRQGRLSGVGSDNNSLEF